MRPWRIIVASAAPATIVAALMFLPRVLAVPGIPDIPALLLDYLPTGALIWLGIYGLSAATLTTIGLFLDLRTARRHVEQATSPAAPHTALIDAVPPLLPGIRAQLRRTSYELEPDIGRSLAAEEIILPGLLRNECARLYFGRLARTHCLTALVLLVCLAIAGAAGTPTPAASATPADAAAPALGVVAILLVAAALGRLALIAAIEPLVRALARLRIASTELRLLRQILELLQAPAPASAASGAEAERLEGLITSSQRSALNAIGGLTSAVDGLGRGLRASIDELKPSLPNGAPAAPSDLAEITGELRGAVAALTAAVARIDEPVPALGHAEARAAMPDAPAPPRSAQARLASELQALLSEIDAKI